MLGPHGQPICFFVETAVICFCAAVCCLLSAVTLRGAPRATRKDRLAVLSQACLKTPSFDCIHSSRRRDRDSPTRLPRRTLAARQYLLRRAPTLQTCPARNRPRPSLRGRVQSRSAVWHNLRPIEPQCLPVPSVRHPSLAHAAELPQGKLEVVTDDQQLFEIQFVKIDCLTDTQAAAIHEGMGGQQQDFLAAQLPFAHLALKLRPRRSSTRQTLGIRSPQTTRQLAEQTFAGSTADPSFRTKRPPEPADARRGESRSKTSKPTLCRVCSYFRPGLPSPTISFIKTRSPHSRVESLPGQELSPPRTRRRRGDRSTPVRHQ
jgi:hypothetical protein